MSLGSRVVQGGHPPLVSGVYLGSPGEEQLRYLPVTFNGGNMEKPHSREVLFVDDLRLLREQRLHFLLFPVFHGLHNLGERHYQTFLIICLNPHAINFFPVRVKSSKNRE